MRKADIPLRYSQYTCNISSSHMRCASMENLISNGDQLVPYEVQDLGGKLVDDFIAHCNQIKQKNIVLK